MKILLINPSQKMVYGIHMLPSSPPLGLLHIGAVLEKMGQDVRLIDVDIEGLNQERLHSIINDFHPDLVGITSVTATFNQALEVAQEIKSLRDIPIVLGGIHATVDPAGAITHPNIDFLIKGEGEITICELVKILGAGSFNFEDIKGLWYKKDRMVYHNEDRELIQDLDSIPYSAFHLLKSLNLYLPADAIKAPVAPIITTRGCPFNCTYCCTKQIFGRKVRARSVENVVGEIEILVKRYGVKEIDIMDDCFTYDKDRVSEFCTEIKRRNYKLAFCFSNGIRADQVDYEILKALKDIGLRYVMFGVESGDPQVLKNIKKGLRLDRVKEAFRIAKSLRLETWACFIIGLPGDTDQTIRRSIDFAKEIDPDFAKFLILKPFPGTEVFKDLQSKGLITDLNYDYFGVYTKPVHYLPEMSSERMLEWQKKANREFYLRPSKIFRHLLMMLKSWQRVKVSLRGLKLMLKLMK